MDCPQTVRGLSINIRGLSMSCPWAVHGLSTSCRRTARGLWIIRGLSASFPWAVCGLSGGVSWCPWAVRDYPWAVCGVFIPWNIHGDSSKRRPMGCLPVGCRPWAVRELSTGCPRDVRGLCESCLWAVRGLSVGYFSRGVHPPLSHTCGQSTNSPWTAHG